MQNRFFKLVNLPVQFDEKLYFLVYPLTLEKQFKRHL